MYFGCPETYLSMIDTEVESDEFLATGDLPEFHTIKSGLSFQTSRFKFQGGDHWYFSMDGNLSQECSPALHISKNLMNMNAIFQAFDVSKCL